MENDLIAYIAEHVSALKDKIKPVFTSELEQPSMVYGTTPMTTGVVNQTQLKVKILAKDYDACKEVIDAVTCALDMSGDMTYRLYRGIRFRTTLAGGGEPVAPEAGGSEYFEATLYFIINWRKRNVTG